MEFLFSSLREVLGEELSVLPTDLLSGEAAAGGAGAAGLGSSLALVLGAASAGGVGAAGASFLDSVALRVNKTKLNTFRKCHINYFTNHKLYGLCNLQCKCFETVTE